MTKKDYFEENFNFLLDDLISCILKEKEKKEIASSCYEMLENLLDKGYTYSYVYLYKLSKEIYVRMNVFIKCIQYCNMKNKQHLIDKSLEKINNIRN